MTQENSQAIKGTCLSDRYEVVDHVSVKAGRETFLAKDLQTQGLVIIKLLKFGTGIDWNQIKLFEREAQILKTLSHDSIPKYRDYFELNLSNIQGFALVQDYIDAKSLEEQLQAGRRFSEAEIKQLATKKSWIEDLTQDEADWLASELCYSLDLPLVKQKMQSVNELNHE